jgi:two-component system OmpR family response regulator
VKPIGLSRAILTGARILIIDDDLDTLTLLRITLQRKGYRVHSASSWDEVIDRLRILENNHEIVDLVILDIMMPERSGFEVYISLQVVLHPVPPIIFLTAKTSIDDMVKASDMGAFKYLTKPTTKDKLLAAVEEALKSRR